MDSWKILKNYQETAAIVETFSKTICVLNKSKSIFGSKRVEALKL